MKRIKLTFPSAVVMAAIASVAGAADPIRVNLARTSIAAISASSVNGQRELTNEFYGIVRAFDNGDAYVATSTNTRYTFWLAETGDDHPSAEVYFTSPVTVQSLVVEGGPTFSAALTTTAGETFYVAKTQGVMNFEKSYQKIAKVVFTFVPAKDEIRDDRLVRVDEIRVMGTVDGDAKFQIESPRVLVSPREAELEANQHFETLRAAKREIKTTDTSITVTFFDKAGREMARAVTDRLTKKVEHTQLVDTPPAAPNKQVPAVEPADNKPLKGYDGLPY